MSGPTAASAALFVAFLLLMSAIRNAIEVYRGMMTGALDLRGLFALRFEILSAGMLLLLASSLPGGA